MRADIASSPPSCCRASRCRCVRSACPTHVYCTTSRHPTARLADASRLSAEAEGGFNIEGLAATPEGKLLIGLRNPLPQRRALVVPLENPAELIEGKTARFGLPIELDLDQRGIRSLELVGASYLIVAGPSATTASRAVWLVGPA